MKENAPPPGMDNLAKNGGLFALGIASQNALHYLTFIIITRFLGPHLFGVFVLVSTIFRFAAMAGTMGINTGLIRLAACLKARGNFSEIRGVFNYAGKAALASSCLAGTALIFSAPFLAEKFLHGRELAWAIIAAGFAVPFAALGGVWLSGLQGLDSPRYRVYTEKIFHPALTCALSAALLSAGLQLEAVITAMIIPAVATAAIALRWVRKTIPPGSGRPAGAGVRKELLSSSGLLFASAVLNLILVKTDLIMLGYFRPAAEAGIYGAAARVGLLILIPFFGFNEIFSPVIAALSARGESTTLNSISKKVARWTVTLSFPLFAILFSLSGPVMGFLGEGFEKGAVALMVLCSGYMVQAAIGSPGYIIAMSGRIKLEFYNSMAACVLNFILNYLLIPHYGIQGAALATATSFTAVNVAKALQARFLLNVNPISAGMLKPLVSALTATGILLLFRRALPADGMSPRDILLFAGVSAMVFAGVLFLLKINASDKAILMRVLGAWHHRAKQNHGNKKAGEETSPDAGLRPGRIGKVSPICYHDSKRSGTDIRAKRALDIFFSGLGLLLLFPLFAVIGVLIKLEGPGPVLYVSKRCGRKGKEFNFYKFRSMVKDAESQKQRLLLKSEVAGPVFKIKNDPRVTMSGRFLRKYSVDELPQLMNVLKGDMSLVGPRPLLSQEVAVCGLDCMKRLSVKPGITCMWQIRGRSDLSFYKWFKWDLWYIDNWSFRLDLKILFWTLVAVLKAKGAY